jgi:hypothetical protein
MAKDEPVKINELFVLLDPTPLCNDAVILRGEKKSLLGYSKVYVYLLDAPRQYSEQIISFARGGNLDTNYIRDVMKWTGRHVEETHLQAHSNGLATSTSKFSTGEVKKAIAPLTSVIYTLASKGLASKADIYADKGTCYEKNRYGGEMREIIEAVEHSGFMSLEDFPPEQDGTEVDFNPNGYEELTIGEPSHMDFLKGGKGKKLGDIPSVSYSGNGKTFVFPLPVSDFVLNDKLVLKKYADKLKDLSEGKIVREALKEDCREMEHMEVMDYILGGTKVDSVFVSSPIIKTLGTPNVFAIEPKHEHKNTFIRLERNGVKKTFETSYFFGFNSAFLHLDNIMLNVEVELPRFVLA